VRPLDDYLAEYEFSARHRIAVRADTARIDQAVREVTLAEIPLARALVRLRGIRARADRPVVETMRRRASVLEDVRGEGLVLALSGQFWRLRGGDREGPRAEAVIDFRTAPGALSTETRVHVSEPAARRKFARYWRVVRPFSGLLRILVLRAAKRRAEAAG
jgi:hypothetical protein